VALFTKKEQEFSTYFLRWNHRSKWTLPTTTCW